MRPFASADTHIDTKNPAFSSGPAYRMALAAATPAHPYVEVVFGPTADGRWAFVLDVGVTCVADSFVGALQGDPGRASAE